ENLMLMADAMYRMAQEIEDTVILGIKTRGDVMGQRLQKMVEGKYGLTLPCGALDISLYRDDLSELAVQPQVKRTQLDFEVRNKQVLLIDDVLYTGRTIRAAIDEIIDFGRPRAIRLLVLVDRGGRELPIQADFCSQTVTVADNEVVKVCLNECDGAEQVLI